MYQFSFDVGGKEREKSATTRNCQYPCGGRIGSRGRDEGKKVIAFVPKPWLMAKRRRKNRCWTSR